LKLEKKRNITVGGSPRSDDAHQEGVRLFRVIHQSKGIAKSNRIS